MNGNALASSAVLLALVGCAPPPDTAFVAFIRGDYKTAFAEYLPRAEKGDNTAELNIALMYARGDGVAQDLAAAQHWMEKAAVDGNDVAAAKLGDAYRKSDDGPPDYGLAFKWYKLGADRHDPHSELELSILYEHGLGMPPDHDEAIHWLNIYIAQTNVVGQKTYFKFTGGDNTGGFMQAIHEVLSETALYSPTMQRFNGGVVYLLFSYKDGRAVDVSVEKSSGDPKEDAAAVDIMQQALLPPVLASLSHAEHFQIAIDFSQPQPRAAHAIYN